MSKIRVGILMPRIGVGYDDRFICDLIRNSSLAGKGLLEWQGVVNLSVDPMTRTQADKARQWLGRSDDFIHVAENPQTKLSGVAYHTSTEAACQAAFGDCDVVIAWKSHFNNISDQLVDIPLIWLSQESTSLQRRPYEELASYARYHLATAQNCFYESAEHNFPQVIRQGVDPARVSPRFGGEQQRELWKTGFGMKVLLALHSKAEDFQTVLDTAAALPEGWVTVCMSRVGYSSNEADRYLSDRFYFLESWFHLGDALSAATCFLYLDKEGFPAPIYEAWLAGCAVVTNNTTLPELETKAEQQLAISIDGDAGAAKEVIASRQPEFAAVKLMARQLAWEKLTIATAVGQLEIYIDSVIRDWRARRISSDILQLNPNA